MPRGSIISVKDLCKDYYQYKVFMRGKLLTKALKNVSFKVQQGDFFGLLGKNGAGKSTLLKILTTNLNKTSGQVFVNGYDVERDVSIVKQNISWMFGVDYFGVGWSSVEKNMMLAAYFLGLERGVAERRVREMLEYFDLYKNRKLDVWRMSTGMQGRYSLAVAMLKNPKILFLDEPLLGLDVTAKDQLRELLRKLNHDGTTIVYTDQQLQEVEKVCRNVVLIDNGEKAYDGSIEDLKHKYRDTNVVELTCLAGNINRNLIDLHKQFGFVTDYEIMDSNKLVHNVKIFTNIDSKDALLKIALGLEKKGVVIEKMNSGLLDLEDVFKKVLRKDKNAEQAAKLHYFSMAGEKPLEQQLKYLKHGHHKVRGAACRAFLHTKKKEVENTLRRMLQLTNEMKIESLKVIGDAKLRHLLQGIKSNDLDVKMHIALAMGKIGDMNSVDVLTELLLDERSCRGVLEQLPRLDKNVLSGVNERVAKLGRSDKQFLKYHAEKVGKDTGLIIDPNVRKSKNR